MQYKVEQSLKEFTPWSGGSQTWSVLYDKDDLEATEMLIEEMFGEEIPTVTEINDFLWFERDFIAQNLGYKDWEDYTYESR